MNLKKYWPILLFIVGVIAMFGWFVYTEIRIHYYAGFNGRVTRKEKIPPKKMPELVIAGSNENFPIWKWKGIDFDSVHVGDSIVKRKHESKAFWYKRKSNGSFQQIELIYWSE